MQGWSLSIFLIYGGSMKKYVGNCSSVIDWNKVIDQLHNLQPQRHGYENPYADDLSDHNYHSIDPLHSKSINTYSDRSEVVEFFTYLNGDHYSHSVNDKFADWIGCSVYHSWISRIDPGRCVPPHVDYDDIIQLEKQNVPKDKWVRYHCHITPPAIGAAFMMDDGTCYHMEEQGAVYQWSDLAAVHSGFNSGHEVKYLFNFIGIKK